MDWDKFLTTAACTVWLIITSMMGYKFANEYDQSRITFNLNEWQCTRSVPDKGVAHFGSVKVTITGQACIQYSRIGDKK